MKRLAPLILLLTSSCISVLDVSVTNPCDRAATMGFWTFDEPPTPADAQRALHGTDQYDPGSPDDLVPGHAQDFLIAGKVVGRLPFEGGYGIAEWEGGDRYIVFRVRPANVEPVTVRIPEQKCPTLRPGS